MRGSKSEARETVRFAQLGVTVEAVRLAGRMSRILVEAPAEFDVLTLSGGSDGDTPSACDLNHRQRNWLNTAALALHLANKQPSAHDYAGSEASLNKALEQLQLLDGSLTGQTPQSFDAARSMA